MLFTSDMVNENPPPPGTTPGEAHKMPASVETKTSHLLVTLICNTLAKSNYVFTNSLSLHNTN